MSSNISTSLVEDLTPATGSIDMDALLNNIEKYIQERTVLPEGASTVITLWCLSTYLINHFRIYPKLIVTSPEKRCGKSTLLDLIEAFSYKPLLTSNMSTAVIFRLIDIEQPTLIMDEVISDLALIILVAPTKVIFRFNIFKLSNNEYYTSAGFVI